MRVISEIWQRRQQTPQHPALELGGKTWNYTDLINLAEHLSSSLDEQEGWAIGVYASKSLAQYIGPLAVVAAGKTFVPLNPSFPLSRTIHMMQRCEINCIVTDSKSLPLESPFFHHCRRHNITVLFVDSMPQATEMAGIHDQAWILQQSPRSPLPPPALAYILFTSGSTGDPKGVAITPENLDAYVQNIRELYPLTTNDRCSQTFESTFDLAIHDLFVTLTQGSTLVPLGQGDLLFAAKFIKNNQLTTWFSVPAVAMLMARMGTLKERTFPTLRLSLFCGEALPTQTAMQWQKAANQSEVVNLYGPTEGTIAICHHRLQTADQEYQTVPIGKPFQGQGADIKPSTGDSPDKGELVISGSQISPGYFKDPEKTKQSFSGENKRTYKTGDIVQRQSCGTLHFIGRLDSQIKLHGFRIELGEIEASFRAILGHDLVVAIPMPENNAVDEIVLCIQGHCSWEEVCESAKNKLPKHMIPQRCEYFEKFPTNSNGKIDRREISELLKSMTSK